VGETFAFFRDGQFSAQRHDRHGPVFKTRLLGQPTLFLKSPEANQFVLLNEDKYFETTWPDSVSQLLGPLSLATQTGAAHKQRRRLMAQAFQSRTMAGYLAGMEAIIERYGDRWLQMGEFAWYPELRNLTLDIACKLLVDLDHGAQTTLGEAFETWSEGLFSIPLKLPWTRFGRAMRARDRLIAEIDQIVAERMRQGDPGSDALGLMLQARDEDGRSLDPQELGEQVLLLLFAGHETLTSALASFCRLTAQHPEVLAKLRDEQAQFDPQAPLTVADLKAMTYLDWTIQEVLRLVPPVGGGFRRAIADCAFNGYRIPKGWMVLYQINRTHEDPEVYPEPERFDPERWNPERLRDHPFSNIPFGGGVRECLGKEFARLEMRAFAALLVRGFGWELVPDQDLSLVVVPTPRPRDGLRVRFQAALAGGSTRP
jgi:cytochrome P450